MILQWPGLHPLFALKALCSDPLKLPFEIPAWMWVDHHFLDLDVVSGLSLCNLATEIPFTSAGEIRFWKFRNGATIEDAVNETFSFRTGQRPFVTTTPDGVKVDVSSFPFRGRSYQVEFWPQPFQIHPYGTFLLDPLTSVFQVQQLISSMHTSGRAGVRIFANGKPIHSDVPIVTADAFGPLRARFFCLPGGAPGALAAVSEQLQTLLVAHGHPSGNVKVQANTLIDKFGQKRCKQILDSKAVWPT